MKTEVIMKREIFGQQISQKSKSEFFGATDLVNAGNQWRLANGMKGFNLSQYLNLKSTTEYVNELENRYGKVVIKGRGRNSQTWVHPLLFIDIALAISPNLKIEVYEWLFDNLIAYRNDSGDSYKEMCAALSRRYTNKRELNTFIMNVANYIKQKVGVRDWQNATEDQLKTRDRIHLAIKLYCNVLKDPRKAVSMGINEYTK